MDNRHSKATTTMSTPPRPQQRHFSPVPSASGFTRNVSPGQRRNSVANDRAPLPSTPKLVPAADTASPQRSNSASSSCSEDPDNTCAICLGKPSNKSFTDSCYHPFCFSCLVEWSKVKANCPLCQKPFRTIVHNIKENYEFEQYHIFQNLRPSSSGNRSFSAANDRRCIYELGYYARPTGYSRYRDISAEFFLNNPAQAHRLIPWLNRELLAILSSPHSLTYVLEMTLGMISRVDIRSSEMRQVLDHYLRPFTEHFQHEFYCFASSPHDISTFDRNAEYEYRPPLCYNEAIARIQRTFGRETLHGFIASSSVAAPLFSSVTRTDENFSAFRPWSSQPGTSRQNTTNSPQPSTSGTQNPRTTFYIDSSSDDDDCQVVKVIKPLRERTPILIDLCESDTSESAASEADTIPAEDSSTDTPTTDEDDDDTDEAKSKILAPGRPKSVIGAFFPGPSSRSPSLLPRLPESREKCSRGKHKSDREDDADKHYKRKRSK